MYNLGPMARSMGGGSKKGKRSSCLLYTSDAADDMQCVDLGGRRIIKKIFFKQKTAYEIMPSLVGSEMCIRDRCVAVLAPGGSVLR